MTFATRILTLGALLCAGTAHAGTPGWTVSESSGAVTVTRPGYSAVVVRGGAVNAGDIVSTGKNGRAVLVRGEEYLVVSPGARITIADPKPGAMTQIIQSFGNTLYKIKKMATPHFAVETPYLAAVVKGTVFSVTVTPKGASVQVTEGRVEVATPDGGASYLVTPGEIGIVNRDAPYRLKIEGKEARTIDSPNRPAAPTPANTEVPAIETASSLDASISEAVGEGSVQLASLSGGMISGDAAIAIATASARVAPVAPVAPVVAPVEIVALTPPVPTGTAVAVLPAPEAGQPAVGAAPPATGPVVDVPTGAALPAALPPVPADAISVIPAITPPAETVTPGVGVDTPPATMLPPTPSEVVAAVLPVPPSVVLQNPIVANLPASAGGNGNGNNGNGLGNGGGDGSNAGGQGNGRSFDDDDRDDNRGRGRTGDDDDDDDGSRRGRNGRGRGDD